MKCEPIQSVAATWVAVCLATIIGCDSSGTTSRSTSATSTEAGPPATAPQVPDMTAALGGKKSASEASSGHGDDQAAGRGDVADDQSGKTAAEEVQEERQVAVAGVGKKGSRYGGGMITEPVSQYFGARERITFLSIQKAMRTFQALHERLPDSHEEFMDEIVKENGLTLPGLFDDERYEYDPEAGELMVVRPKKN